MSGMLLLVSSFSVSLIGGGVMLLVILCLCIIGRHRHKPKHHYRTSREHTSHYCPLCKPEIHAHNLSPLDLWKDPCWVHHIDGSQ